jgi:hypothetical protein
MFIVVVRESIPMFAAREPSQATPFLAPPVHRGPIDKLIAISKVHKSRIRRV